MEWNVYYFNINKQEITTFDIFKHCSSYEYSKKALKKCETKDEFAKVLRREMQYYFWCKCEWELIIEITEDNRILLSPWCGCRNSEDAKVDVTDDTNFDWRGFAEAHIRRQVNRSKAKIDVFSQVDYVWDEFVDCCWNQQRKRKRKKKETNP